MSEFIEATFTSGTANASLPVFNNVFIYRSPTLTGNPNSYSAGLIEALTSYIIDDGTTQQTFVQAWREVISVDIAIKSLRVRNLYNDLDFAETSFLLNVGSWPGDALSPTSALSFRAARARTGRNRWRKRISGIPESQFNRGVLNPVSGYENDVRRLAYAMESPIVGSDGETARAYTPIVLYSEITEVDGQKFYNRPLTALTAQGLNEQVTGIEYSTTTATQVTRKVVPNYVPGDIL